MAGMKRLTKNKRKGNGFDESGFSRCIRACDYGASAVTEIVPHRILYHRMADTFQPHLRLICKFWYAMIPDISAIRSKRYVIVDTSRETVQSQHFRLSALYLIYKDVIKKQVCHKYIENEKQQIHDRVFRYFRILLQYQIS